MSTVTLVKFAALTQIQAQIVAASAAAVDPIRVAAEEARDEAVLAAQEARNLYNSMGTGGPGGSGLGVMKTADYTAAAGEIVLCNTSTGSFIVTLPPPVIGARVTIVDAFGTFDNNQVYVHGFTGDMDEIILTTANAETTFHCISAAGDGEWVRGRPDASEVAMIAPIRGALRVFPAMVGMDAAIDARATRIQKKTASFTAANGGYYVVQGGERIAVANPDPDPNQDDIGYRVQILDGSAIIGPLTYSKKGEVVTANFVRTMGVSVTEAGTAGVNLDYVLDGEQDGKARYALGDMEIVWDAAGDRWVIQDDTDVYYYSLGDVVDPWNNPTWVADAGDSPVPVVAENPYGDGTWEYMTTPPEAHELLTASKIAEIGKAYLSCGNITLTLPEGKLADGAGFSVLVWEGTCTIGAETHQAGSAVKVHHRTARAQVSGAGAAGANGDYTWVPQENKYVHEGDTDYSIFFYQSPLSSQGHWILSGLVDDTANYDNPEGSENPWDGTWNTLEPEGEAPAPTVTELTGGGWRQIATPALGSADTPSFASIIVQKPIATIAPAPTIASQGSITPTKAITFVSGTTAIDTIVVPSHFATGGGTLILIPTGLWTTVTGSNIRIATTAVLHRPLSLTWDATTGFWYPSY